MRGTSAPRPRGVGVGRPGGGRHCETQAPGELQGSYCTNGVYSCIVYSHFSIAHCVLQPRPLLHAIPPVPIRPIEPRLVQPHVPCASPHTRRRSRSHCLWMHFARSDSAVRIVPARFVSPHHHRRQPSSTPVAATATGAAGPLPLQVAAALGGCGWKAGSSASTFASAATFCVDTDRIEPGDGRRISACTRSTGRS
mgnify:CR=1 FL=1|jgi:hypothetical protein